MRDYLEQSGLPYVVVVTKVDKLNKTERAQALEEIASSPYTQGVDIIPFSSHTGEGKLELWKYILSKAEL